MTEMIAASRELEPPAQAPRTTALRSSKMSRADSTDYAKEATQLQWLPYLSSLHSRFLHPTGRRDMKEWYVTAQVVHDYVLHRKDPIIKPQTPTPAHFPTRSVASTSSPKPSTGNPGSRAVSLEMQRPDPAAELEQISSHEQGSNHSGGKKPQSQPDTEAISPRSSVQGFRISLSGIGGMRDPRRVFTKASRPTSPSLDGPSSPPLGATEFSFSPSSSRRDLNVLRKRTGPLSDDPGSSEMSMSDGVTDAEDPFVRRGAHRRRTAESSKNEFLSASDDDTRFKPGLGGRLPGKPRWATPLFSRRNTDKNLPIVMTDPPHSPLSGPEEQPEDVIRRPTVQTTAFTAGFLTQFPRAQHSDPHTASLRWEEMQRRQRDHYADKQA